MQRSNLTASYLWQPAEFARRMIGERPSAVPPTRELWPRPQQQPLSVSTLHIAYMQEEPPARRTATLPPPQQPPPAPTGRTRAPQRPQLCTIGTNTDPPPTIITRLRKLIRRDDPNVKVIVGQSIRRISTATTAMSAPKYQVSHDETENSARRAFKSIKNAISFKHKVAPDSEIVESPKIVYDTSKPGDRMNATFGRRQSRNKWCKMPSKTACTRQLRSVGDWCMRPYQGAPKRRHSQPPPRLQMTQV